MEGPIPIEAPQQNTVTLNNGTSSAYSDDVLSPIQGRSQRLLVPSYLSGCVPVPTLGTVAHPPGRGRERERQRRKTACAEAGEGGEFISRRLLSIL